MELEEMKQMWQKYDKALQENKLLNERIVSNMLNDKSGNAIRRMLNFEYLGMAIVTVVFIVFIVMWRQANDHTNIFICYLISLLYLVAAIVMGVYKIQLLSSTDPGSDSIVVVTERMEKFRLFMTRERFWGILLLLPALFACFTVVEYFVHGANIFDKIEPYIFRLIVAVVAAIVVSLVIYNKVYFKSIEQIKQNLAEIEKFRQEG